MSVIKENFEAISLSVKYETKHNFQQLQCVTTVYSFGGSVVEKVQVNFSSFSIL